MVFELRYELDVLGVNWLFFLCSEVRIGGRIGDVGFIIFKDVLIFYSFRLFSYNRLFVFFESRLILGFLF